MTASSSSSSSTYGSILPRANSSSRLLEKGGHGENAADDAAAATTTTVDDEEMRPMTIMSVAAAQENNDHHHSNSHLRSASYAIRSTLAIVVVLGLGSLLLVSVYLLPSRKDYEMASLYDIPLWGANQRVMEAQHLADTSGLYVMADDTADTLKRAVQSIVHPHNGNKHGDNYVDPPEGCESTVVLVRHCEKEDVREHCAYSGYERSVYLASIFGDSKGERWPAPSYILAMSPGGRHNQKKMNFREIETVGPLATKVGVPIDYTYSTKTVNRMTSQIMTLLQSGAMCGQVLVVAWKHSQIGHIAHRLGCGPTQGCPIDYRGKSFDEVWQIKAVYKKVQHSTRHSLKLEKRPEWRVYGSVQQEGFDPLAFSKRVGDYPPGGTDNAARWQAQKVAVPERERPNDKKTWDKVVDNTALDP